MLIGTLGWALAFRSLIGVLLAALLIAPTLPASKRNSGAALTFLSRL
jgi:hypothetical protein